MNHWPDHLDAIEQKGLEWIDRMLSGEATTGDLEDMRRWRSLSARHAAALAYAARVRRAVAAAAPQCVETPAARTAPSRLHASRRALIGGALAASVTAYMAARPPMGLWPSLDEMFADYRTRTGEQRRVALRRGVVLDLNTQTSVALRSGGEGRQAELIDGETLATVDVPDDRRFVLSAANGQVSAVRARFNVRRTPRGVSVTCVNGQTNVACGAELAALQAGQRVDYAPGGLGAVVPASADVTAAWSNGLIIFHDQPLREVIDNVNRYRANKIVVMNAALGGQRMSGSLHLDRLDEVVAQVRLNGARVTTLPGGVVLLS
ncbi:MAG TPA: FecR domain-containing protein [Caulobacteraceae bacterium]|jgi:transmembrane sensor|nr:FecR domain-containing protein [Caulobacteraceae bacterium]